MRTGKPPREFFKIMKKKPALQEILDSFDDYTVEQLENIKGQPLWVRKVLVEMKNKPEVNEERIATIEAMADRMMKTTEAPTQVKYEVREWTGGDWLMSCGMTGSLKIEVKVGDCLYIIDCDHPIEKYIVGMDSAVGILTVQQWNSLLNNSTYVGTMTKPEYASFVSERLGKQFTNRDEIARTAGPSSYVSPEESKKGFTIIRHDVK